LSHERDWLAAHFAPLAVLYPRHDYGPVLRREPDFHTHFLRAGVPFVSLGARLMAAQTGMRLFLDRAGGFMVLAALLQAAMAGDDPTHAAVPYGDVGDRFDISRTHVRRLPADAEAAGLARLRARGGQRVELLPRLWASHDRGMAAGMYLHDIVYTAATSRHDDARRETIMHMAGVTAAQSGYTAAPMLQRV
jgi:hypothetical protein